MLKYFLLFIFCFTVFILHTILAGHAIYGDGNAYYSYAHALYFERSLNFGPIYSHLSNFQGPKYIFSRVFWNPTAGPSGFESNPYSIGTGIAWLPSLFFINLINIVLRLDVNKFSIIYELGPGITGIILTLAGLYFTEKYLRNFFSEKISLITVSIIFLTSNLLYYSSFEPALSHQPAFFIISFLLYKTHRMKSTLPNFFLIGFLSGFLASVRLADTILLIPILLHLILSKPDFKKIIAAVSGGAISFSPLLWSQYLMYGNALKNPYLTGTSLGFFNPNLGHIIEFFVSAKRGLFLWHPIYLISLVGLFKKDFRFIFTLILLFGVAALWSANTSAGFGQRYVIGAIPYFAFGLATVIEKLNFKTVAITALILLVWNFLTLFQFYFDARDLVKNEDLTLRQFVSGQFTAPVKALRIISSQGIKNFFYKNVLD